MGIHGFGRMGSMQEIYSIHVTPTYGWFPFIWYDLVKLRYVLGLGKPLERITLKHRVSKKEAIAFKKLME